MAFIASLGAAVLEMSKTQRHLILRKKKPQKKPLLFEKCQKGKVKTKEEQLQKI